MAYGGTVIRDKEITYTVSSHKSSLAVRDCDSRVTDCRGSGVCRPSVKKKRVFLETVKWTKAKCYLYSNFLYHTKVWFGVLKVKFKSPKISDSSEIFTAMILLC